MPPTRTVSHGDTIGVGDAQLSVIHLRGHTPGSIALSYDAGGALADEPHLFTGDSLFPGGPGNTENDPERFNSLITDLENRIFARAARRNVGLPGPRRRHHDRHGASARPRMARPRLVTPDPHGPAAPARAEIVVVGGGITGLSAAWALTRRGREVVVLDQAPVGHSGGGSHGSCRIFRRGYEDASYVTLAGQARRPWTELEDVSGERLLRPDPAAHVRPADAAGSGRHDCGRRILRTAS